jgi:hypothetical protein
VAVSAGIVAPVSQFVARIGQLLRGLGLYGLRGGDRSVRFVHGSVSAFGSGARFLGGIGGF